MVGKPKDAEEQVRVRLTEFEKFLIRVWKQGAGGKLGLVLIYLAYGHRKSRLRDPARPRAA